jgi:hypothetical protein
MMCVIAICTAYGLVGFLVTGCTVSRDRGLVQYIQHFVCLINKPRAELVPGNNFGPRSQNFGPGTALLNPRIRSSVPGSHFVPRTSPGGPKTVNMSRTEYFFRNRPAGGCSFLWVSLPELFRVFFFFFFKFLVSRSVHPIQAESQSSPKHFQKLPVELDLISILRRER